ncbi:polysaccharide biosynthesis/export family protein [Mucilaginibacter sp. JRF]|uniref:polysaccharide biosynthesis/export family protein n=1 Tax=Mucilaginibacter sp. JRF TaxID=2780088 RepID=UPI001881D7AC|nr:polysaccharide biosynthesis/export family protein [Mucilaginibacter sp. JRF]MBE9585870.1 polysaccharide biosynthesis/export family protein [Mucilaginibacter sp. JRF]
MKKISAVRFGLLISIAAILFSSCGSTKKIRYFQDLPETSQANEFSAAEYVEPTIQPDDILAITVTTNDPLATNAINSRNGGLTNTAGANPQAGMITPVSGYLVNKAGFVEVPTLGSIKLLGLTTMKARETVRDKAAKFFVNPVVDVRYSNFRVTVLGEVNRPASYVIPNEQVTLLDAIGYAGDLTFFGKRNNITLIRKDGVGRNISVKIDLTKKSAMNSPYFYLKQNDVIYVEPNKTKVLNNDNNAARFITIAATVFTAIILGVRYL